MCVLIYINGLPRHIETFAKSLKADTFEFSFKTILFLTHQTHDYCHDVPPLTQLVLADYTLASFHGSNRPPGNKHQAI